MKSPRVRERSQQGSFSNVWRATVLMIFEDMDVAIRCVKSAEDLCYQAEKFAIEMMHASDPTKAIEQLKVGRPGFPDDVYYQAIIEAKFGNSR